VDLISSTFFLFSHSFTEKLLEFLLLSLFLVGLGFELGFALAKQALYCWSHTSSPFCSGLELRDYLPGLALN
jgi:hypothetical protein